MKYHLLSILVVLGLISSIEAKQFSEKANLDFLIDLKLAVNVTPDYLDKKFSEGKEKNAVFEWLNTEKSRAIFKKHIFNNVDTEFNILGGEVSLEEAVVDFTGGKFAGVTLSIHNRGDGGEIKVDEFIRRQKAIEKFTTELLGKKPRVRKGNIKKGIMTSGLIWNSTKGKAVLVNNIEAPQKTEFLRFRISPRDTQGIYEAAQQDRSLATTRKSKLPRNVIKKNGDVYIVNFPMVDQGSKGYCVVASAQRLFEYYGIACDMHQLAQLAKSDPKKGTNSLLINKELGAIDYLFQMRYSCLAIKQKNTFFKLKNSNYLGKEIKRKNLFKTIYSYLDKGIPILWSLELGVVPELPSLNPQAVGGHMRMIIGYNLKDETIIFSDSWGQGHEFKRMKTKDFYKATTAIFVMTPTNH